MRKITKPLISLAVVLLITSNVFAQFIVAKVTFRVDMKYQIAKGTFIPNTDFVDVAGLDLYGNGTNSSKDWNTYTKANAKRILKPDPNNATIYVGTFTDTVKKPTAPATAYIIEYKYRINGQWGNSDQSPAGSNRTQDVSDDAGMYDIPTVVYLNESGTIYTRHVKFIVNMKNPVTAKKFVIGTDFVDVTCFDGNCDTRPDKASNPNVLVFQKDSTYAITKSIVAVIPDGAPKTIKVKFTFRINGVWTNRDTAVDKIQDPNAPDRQLVVDFGASNDYVANVIYQGKGNVVTVTGIKEFSDVSHKIKIQNPVADNILVFNDRHFSYEVFDMTGKLLKNGYSNSGEIGVMDLVPGIYFLKLTNDQNNTGIVRFIKL
jgi:hypothetical protein